MVENPAVSVPQMNQETVLAQEALRDEAPQGHPDAEADFHHETRDADVVRIGRIGAGMGTLGICLFLFLWLLLSLFRHIPVPVERSISPLALNPPTPMEPRIQEATPQNYQRFLGKQEAILNSSGAVPPEERAWQRDASTRAGSRGDLRVAVPFTTNATPNLDNPGPGVIGPNSAQMAAETVHRPIEEAENELLNRGFPTRPEPRRSSFPQAAPLAGWGKPESLPLAMQPTGAYRADVGPMGKNP